MKNKKQKSNETFALLSTADLKKLADNLKTKSTSRTNNWVSVYQKWAELRGLKTKLEE